jgi:hypothetical protein
MNSPIFFATSCVFTVLLLSLGFYCKNRVEGRNYLNWLLNMNLPVKGHLIASIACFVLGAVAATLAIASGITIFS